MSHIGEKFQTVEGLNNTINKTIQYLIWKAFDDSI